MTLKNIFSKVLIGLLAGAICVSATSCGDTSWVVQVDGEKLPAGLYLLNQSSAIQMATTEDGYDDSLEDKWDNVLEDKSLKDWVNDEAKKLTVRYVQIDKLFEEKGFTLTEEDNASIESNVEYMWQYMSEYYEQMGISKDSYTKAMEYSMKEEDLFLDMYGTEGEKAVSDDEIKTYYGENYLKVNVVTYSTVNDETGEAMTDEEKAEVEAKANEDLKRIQEGTSIATIIAEKKAEAEQAQATEETTEGTTPTEEETQIEIHIDGSNSISDDLTTKIFEQAVVNEPILLSDDDGYYIVKTYETTLSDEDLSTRRDQILYKYKYEEFEEYVDGLAQNLNVVVNQNAVNTFKPKKWDAE